MAEVRYDVDVNTKDAVKDVNKLRKSLDKNKKAMRENDRGSSEMSKGFSLAKAGILAFAAAVVAASVAAVKVASNFETLRTTLATVSGGAKEGAIAFKFIQEIAAQLPGSLEETTTAYTKLLALGITPTRAALISFANTASATGKSLDQFVEAVADATTGEFERLKEFGIKVKQETDSIKVTFQGVTTSIAKDSASIQGYLQGIGENQFAGAATKQMDTLAGRFSNFKDTLSKLADEIVNSSGGMDLLKSALSSLTDIVEFFREAIKTVPGAIQGIVDIFKEWLSWIGITQNDMDVFIAGVTDGFNFLMDIVGNVFRNIRSLSVILIDTMITGFLKAKFGWNVFTEAMAFAFDKAVEAIKLGFIVILTPLINLNNALADIFDSVDRIDISLLKAGATTESWEERFKRVNDEFETNLKLHKDSINLWLQDIENSKELNRVQKDNAIAERKKELAEFEAQQLRTKEAQLARLEASKLEAAQAKKAAEFIKTLKLELLSLANANKTTGDKIRETADNIALYQEQLEATGVTQEQFNRAQAQLAENAKRESREFKDGWELAMEDYAENATNAAQTAKDVFADTTAAIEETIKSFVTTGKLEFKSLVASIINSLLDAQIAKLTSNLFSGSVGSGGNGVGAFFAGFFAAGGLIPAGGVGVVGERGPELISGPAQITPLGNTGGNITYNINAVDADSFKQLVARDPAFIFAVTEQGRRSLPSGR